MELVRSGDESGLERLLAAEPRAARFLMGRLWDPAPEVRATAARALGSVAESHPGLAVEVLRRVVWGLNDESATNGVYGIPVFAEIACRAPELAAPFVGPVASYLSDAGLRSELLVALEQVAARAPQIMGDAVGHMRDLTGPESHDLVERVLGHMHSSDRTKEVSNGT